MPCRSSRTPSSLAGAVALLLTGCSLGADLDTSAVEALRCAGDGDCPSGAHCGDQGYCAETSPPDDTVTAPDLAEPDAADTFEVAAPDTELDGPDDDAADLAGDADASCPGLVCGEACVDPLDDPAHCGGCDLACDAHLSCVEGRCDCAPPLTDCARLCVELATNESNCGSCGIACGDGAICLDGVCHCGDAAGELCEAEGDAVLGAACAGRTCNLTCMLGRADCNDDPTDGCEGEVLCP